MEAKRAVVSRTGTFVLLILLFFVAVLCIKKKCFMCSDVITITLQVPDSYEKETFTFSSLFEDSLILHQRDFSLYF